MSWVEALQGFNAGLLEKGAHWRIKRPIGPGHFVTELAEQAGERGHARAPDGNQIDLECSLRQARLRRLLAVRVGQRKGDLLGSFGQAIYHWPWEETGGTVKIPRFIPMIFVLLVVAPICVTSAAIAEGRVVVDRPVVDVGAVARGDEIEHRFVLKNAGDAPLTVREVKPACGCTIARFDKSIPAGGTGSVSAVVATQNFSGPIAKAITVFTSDAENPRISLVIKANVQPHIEVEPGYARFILVEGSGVEVKKQTLWTVDGPELEVKAVRSPYPFLRAEHRRVEDGRWEVVLTLDRNRAPIGPLADFVEVETNHPQERLMKIPVSGFVRSVVSVVPRVADLGSRDLSEPFIATLEVRNQTDSEISVESVATDVAGVETEIEEVEAGKLYTIVLTLPAGMAKGPFAGKVEIKTNSARRPTIEVDLTGTVL